MIKENTVYCEPCLDTLMRMDNESIDCVITSPPYWQLRDYGYEGQWGLEPTFQWYLEHLWSMMDEIYRVLKKEGTVWVNLGDTYSKSGESGGNPNKFPEKLSINRTKSDVPNKCLLLIPHRFAIGCIDRGWIVRNDVIWAKRNGMPESVTDRFSKKHEYFFFMVKSEKYYFDLDAIRDNHKSSLKEISRQKRMDVTQGYNEANGTKMGHSGGLGYGGKKNIKGNMTSDGMPRTMAGLHMRKGEEKQNEFGKNPGSVSDFWDGAKKPTFDEYMKQCVEYYYSKDDFFDIPTKPSSSKHYASYNDSLLVKPVLAGCPKGGVIYDPFMGTGSTAEVAIRAGRKFVGSEMSKEYCKITNDRITPFLIQRAWC